MWWWPPWSSIRTALPPDTDWPSLESCVNFKIKMEHNWDIDGREENIRMFYQVNAEQADGHLYDGENHHGEGDAGLV